LSIIKKTDSTLNKPPYEFKDLLNCLPYTVFEVDETLPTKMSSHHI